MATPRVLAIWDALIARAGDVLGPTVQARVSGNGISTSFTTKAPDTNTNLTVGQRISVGTGAAGVRKILTLNVPTAGWVTVDGSPFTFSDDDAVYVTRYWSVRDQERAARMIERYPEGQLVLIEDDKAREGVQEAPLGTRAPTARFDLWSFVKPTAAEPNEDRFAVQLYAEVEQAVEAVAAAAPSFLGLTYVREVRCRRHRLIDVSEETRRLGVAVLTTIEVDYRHHRGSPFV